MNENYENNQPEEFTDLIELFKVIWRTKVIIFLITFLFALASFFYAKSLPDMYMSSAILAPTSEDDGLSSQLDQYSSIASFTGINIPNNNTSKTQEAIQRVQSYDFFKSFILPNIKLENLMAVKKWNSKDNSIVYDKNLYNAESSEWVRKKSHPLSKIPSPQEAYREGYLEILKIKRDKDTGFVTISILHQSPFISKDWVDLIIFNINESMRDLDKNNAENSINFLNASFALTNVQTIKEVITNLLQAEMQTLMLASSNKAYIFKSIDSAFVPEIKFGPRRFMIMIIGILLGMTMSIVVIFINFFTKSIRGQ